MKYRRSAAFRQALKRQCVACEVKELSLKLDMEVNYSLFVRSLLIYLLDKLTLLGMLVFYYSYVRKIPLPLGTFKEYSSQSSGRS